MTLIIPLKYQAEFKRCINKKYIIETFVYSNVRCFDLENDDKVKNIILTMAKKLKLKLVKNKLPLETEFLLEP